MKYKNHVFNHMAVTSTADPKYNWPPCEKTEAGVKCSNPKGMGHRDPHVFKDKASS